MTTAVSNPREATSKPFAPSRGRRTVSLAKWAVLGVVVAGGGLGVWRWRTATPVSPARYETVAVDRGPLAAKVTATGTLSALVTVLVGSQVSGRIASLGADFQSSVKKGQVIATIEPSFFRAAAEQAAANLVAVRANVDRAHAQVVQGEKDYARAQNLLAATLMSRGEFDAIEARLAAARAEEAAARAVVAQAKAAHDQALLNLKYTTIVSPIDGVVISRNVDVGQTVAATLQAPTLFTIAQDLTQMQVDTNVAEGDVGKITAGMKVSFTVDAYPARTFIGVVRQVRDNATTIQNVVTYDAVIDVDNGDRALKPGMTANVTFTWATRDDALRIPNAALRFKPDAATLATMHAAPYRDPVPPSARVVWVLRGGTTPAPVVAKIGIADSAATEILSGELQPGDAAIVEAVATKKVP